MLHEHSPSDVAYLRAVRKAKVYQVLTDPTESESGDGVEIRIEDVDPILDKAQDLLKDIGMMTVDIEDNDISSSTPYDDSTARFLTDAGFKFWFILLLLVFLFISVLIFHFFCYGKKNVTRRNSLSKSTGATETTTMEMISEEIEMDEDGMNPRPVIQDF